MKKRFLALTLLVGLALSFAFPALAKIVPTPQSVTLGR